MIKQEDVYKIGRLGKAHGVHGEISLQFDDDIFDRVDADYLVLELDGILVPFFMEEYRFRSDTVCLVKFVDVDTQQRAQELTGCDIFFPRVLADAADEELSLAGLVGFDIVEAQETGETKKEKRTQEIQEAKKEEGTQETKEAKNAKGAQKAQKPQTVGRIARIDDQTANILFELEDGRLIPANDDLIADINVQTRTITMLIPDGLLTL